MIPHEQAILVTRLSGLQVKTDYVVEVSFCQEYAVVPLPVPAESIFLQKIVRIMI